MKEETIAAVSALSIVDPKLTISKPFFSAKNNSSLRNPPSGPINKLIFSIFLPFSSFIFSKIFTPDLSHKIFKQPSHSFFNKEFLKSQISFSSTFSALSDCSIASLIILFNLTKFKLVLTVL